MRRVALAAMIAVVPLAAWGQFGDGTYLVGFDIEPGIYRAPGGSFCTWQRLSGVSGEFDDIIAIDVSENSGQIVEVKATDKAFKVSGCGRWEPVEEVSDKVSLRAMAAAMISIIIGVDRAVEPDAALIDSIEASAMDHLERVRDEGLLTLDEDMEIAVHALNVAFEELRRHATEN